ncbi:tryptophan synthase subunit beta [Pseudomonas sp. UL073]|uniref:Tryptophan synthase subunit beta n=1 Tax=Zestomonas insulae TaxID=2809017 RepID=A0ABS2ICJ2_9GAMM|nr:tryptophan synthase subunit beta [Pseudomonas insulae]MBM7060388.1 tryptophan synthase subunit beta [Pseudomonas insulae]
MFYVQRDSQGHLIRVEPSSFEGASGTLLPDDHEVQAWLASQAAEDGLLQLKQSDLDMIRVLEDLISVLMTKGVLRITDLPAAAQAKLMSRTQAREALGGISRLINDEETGLI